jgi:hypothetical protein
VDPQQREVLCPGLYGAGRGRSTPRRVPQERANCPYSWCPRASFSNLLILCLPHHGEVDDRRSGETLYPVDTLTRWKANHEGANGPALAALGPMDEETLARLLTQVFSPPARRLQQIADQLEKTGTLTAQNLPQLRQVVQVMNEGPTRANADLAEMLSYAADVLSSSEFIGMVDELGAAAETLLSQAMSDRIGKLSDIAEILDAAPDRIQHNSGEWYAAAQGTLRQRVADCGPVEGERSGYLSANAANRLALIQAGGAERLLIPAGTAKNRSIMLVILLYNAVMLIGVQ